MDGFYAPFYKIMELKDKSKQELLGIARELADKHKNLKETIENMLDELDLIEEEYNEVVKIIKLN